MSNRMLRPWVNSDKVNSLSAHAERLFTRLIMVVDDYGCFYADTRLLKANLFPLLLDSIREADLTRWMAECQKAGLVVLYESAGKKYIQIVDFKQRLDRAKHKFPVPDNASLASVNEIQPEEEVEEKEKRKENHHPLASLGIVVYNAEQTILASPVELERIIMGSKKSKEVALQALHKYHLFLEEKERYPVGRKSVFAGFEKWLMNEKKFSTDENEKLIQQHSAPPLSKL